MRMLELNTVHVDLVLVQYRIIPVRFFCRIADRWLVGSSACTEGKCTSNIKLTMSSDSDDVS